MPELPDLQVFSENLTRQLKGKKLSKVEVVVDKKLNVPAAEFKKTLEGQTLTSVVREGKELAFHFSKGDVVGLHLMLHGTLQWFEETNDHKHTIISFLFADGKGVAVSDWQKNATPRLNPEWPDVPDALSKAITFDFLKNALKRKTPVKNILMDQKVIRGIGNAYADEIFWDAKLSPFSVAQNIPDPFIKALVKSIPRVLVNAEKQIKKEKPDTITGELRDFLPIHNAKKKASPDGGEIKIKVTGGRKTYYTDEQKEF